MYILWIYGYIDISWIYGYFMDIWIFYGYMDIWIFYGFNNLEDYGYGLDMEFNFWMRWIMDCIWNRIAIHPAPLAVNSKHMVECIKCGNLCDALYRSWINIQKQLPSC